MKRYVAAAALVAWAATPALADNKDIQRLQFQVATLQTQVSDLQRLVEENQREMQRLVASLAEQTALFRRSLEDRRMEDEAIQSALREMSDRLGELGERLQAAQVSRNYLAAPGIPVERQPGDTEVAPEDAGAAAQATESAPPPPRELYNQAYADFARANYDLAIQGFEAYLRFYPDTDFSDNAQYWIGECRYGKQDYEGAVEAWNALLRDYTSSDKLPDARVKKGMALERLGRRSQALLEFRFVVERYPNSPAARIAREKLNPR